MRSSSFPLRRILVALLLMAQMCAAQSKPAGSQQPSPARKQTPAAPAKPQTKPAVEKALGNQAPPLVERVLTNGLQVIIYEDHTVPLVTVEFDARAGSMSETAKQNG